MFLLARRAEIKGRILNLLVFLFRRRAEFKRQRCFLFIKTYNRGLNSFVPIAKSRPTSSSNQGVKSEADVGFIWIASARNGSYCIAGVSHEPMGSYVGITKEHHHHLISLCL